MSEIKSISLTTAQGTVEPEFAIKALGGTILVKFTQDIADGEYEVKLSGVKS